MVNEPGRCNTVASGKTSVLTEVILLGLTSEPTAFSGLSGYSLSFPDGKTLKLSYVSWLGLSLVMAVESVLLFSNETDCIIG